MTRDTSTRGTTGRAGGAANDYHKGMDAGSLAHIEEMLGVPPTN